MRVTGAGSSECSAVKVLIIGAELAKLKGLTAKVRDQLTTN